MQSNNLFWIIIIPLCALPALAFAQVLSKNQSSVSADYTSAQIAKLLRSARLGYGPSQYKLGLAYAT